jgi:hypothetical protein
MPEDPYGAPSAPADGSPEGPSSKGNRNRLLGLAGVVAGLAIAAFIALGSSSSSPVDPVAQAATFSSKTGGYRMLFSINVSTSASATPISGTGSGTFDIPDRAGTFSLAMNLGNNPAVVQKLGSSTLRIDEIIDGTTIYMKLPSALTGPLGTIGKKWIELDLSKITGLSALSGAAGGPVSSDPSQMLQFLRAASDSVVSAGRATVDGYSTRRYHAELNPSRIADKLPSSARSAVQKELSALTLHDIPVDVWIDARRLVRRVQLTLAGGTGGQTLNESMTIDIPHYGPEPKPAVPSSGDVANLSSLLGSAATGG